MFKKILSFLIISLILIPNLSLAKNEIDSDRDGLNDALEDYYCTDKFNPDTDNDGYNDYEEIIHGYSPVAGFGVTLFESDLDKDGLNDALEVRFGSKLNDKDSDDDGYDDYTEVLYGYDPIDPKPIKKFPATIYINRSNQTLSFARNNTIIFNLPISTGNYNTETPSGQFKITKKIPSKRYVGPNYDLPNVPWNMEFLPGYYIHGAYWHNDFGYKTHSNGCVNLSIEDAKFLYNLTPVGTKVIITGTTPIYYLSY